MAGATTRGVAYEELSTASGAANVHPEGEWQAEAAGDTDGGFIMHLAQAGLGLNYQFGFCLSGAPNREGVVRRSG